tara:strand:+ start:2250 stop:2525 length:276 start_codon:yes stop_codon:yes gene_type:complete
VHNGQSISVQLPDGRTATFADMQSYGEILQQFIREQEQALPAVQDVSRHNEIIDYLQLLADAYNQQLRVFKAEESRRQRMFQLSLMRFVGG